MRIIRGKYGRRRFDLPNNLKARPTTDFAKESLFALIENRMDIEDTTALDLFAGTGSISFELLSRGASKVIALEKAQNQYNFIRSVQEKLAEKNLILIKDDVFKFLKSTTLSFDFIFADPPYDLPNIEQIPVFIFERSLVKPQGWVIVEHSKKTDLSFHPCFVELRSYGSVNFSFFCNDKSIIESGQRASSQS